MGFNSGFKRLKKYISNFMKTCPVGAELLLGDRQTDMRKLKSLIAVLRSGPKKINCDVIAYKGRIPSL